MAVRASHGFLRGEVLRYLRRAGEPVEPFPGNPYYKALELTESPEVAVASEGLRILDRLGAVAVASLVRRQLEVLALLPATAGPRYRRPAREGERGRRLPLCLRRVSGDDVVELVVGPGRPELHRRPGPVDPDGDRLADLVRVVAVLVHLVEAHLGDVVEVDRQPQPDRLAFSIFWPPPPHTTSPLTLSRGSSFPVRSRFRLQGNEVRLSVDMVPPSARSVLQTSALRARSG